MIKNNLHQTISTLIKLVHINEKKTAKLVSNMKRKLMKIPSLIKINHSINLFILNLSNLIFMKNISKIKGKMLKISNKKHSQMIILIEPPVLIIPNKFQTSLKCLNSNIAWQTISLKRFKSCKFQMTWQEKINKKYSQLN